MCTGDRYIVKHLTMKIHRFNTYPDNKLNEEQRRVWRFDSSWGGAYELSLREGRNGDFQLKTPDGNTIQDNLATYEDRLYLYRFLEAGVPDWMNEIKEAFEQEELEQVGVVKAVLTHNNERYELTLNTKTDAATLHLPEQHREFMMDNIYIDNPDISLLLDGRLIDCFRDQLKKYGVMIPDPPYYPGIIVTG